MKISKDQALSDFDDFIFQMDDRIESLEGRAASVGVRLTMDLSGIDALEDAFDLLSTGIDTEERKDLVITCARYLGEIVRVAYGGRWHLPLDDKKDVHFNMPVIAGLSTIADLYFSPIHLMRAYSLRGRKGTLRTGVDAIVNPKPLDLSDLVEEDPH